MALRLQNLTSRTVSLVLNSGEVLHLPPYYAITPDPVDVKGNAKLEKLLQALVLSLTDDEDESLNLAPEDETGAKTDAAALKEDDDTQSGTRDEGAPSRARRRGSKS